jgi:hypothetical protein
MLPKNRFPLGPGGVRPSAVATSSASVCSFPMIGTSGSYGLFTTSLRIREPPGLRGSRSLKRFGSFTYHLVPASAAIQFSGFWHPPRPQRGRSLGDG